MHVDLVAGLRPAERCGRSERPSRMISDGRAQRGMRWPLATGLSGWTTIGDDLVVAAAGQLELDAVDRAAAAAAR